MLIGFFLSACFAIYAGKIPETNFEKVGGLKGVI